MAYIARHMEKKVLDLSKSCSALLITGPRQAGKTTMLKELAKHEGIGRGYVSLDDLNTRDMAKNDPKLFLQLHKPPVIIDEVQYAPELFTYIKIHVDEHHMPGAFWLQAHARRSGVACGTCGASASFPFIAAGDHGNACKAFCRRF